MLMVSTVCNECRALGLQIFLFFDPGRATLTLFFRNLVSSSFVFSAVAFCTLIPVSFIYYTILNLTAFVFSFIMKYINEYFHR